MTARVLWMYAAILGLSIIDYRVWPDGGPAAAAFIGVPALAFVAYLVYHWPGRRHRR